MTQYSDVSDDRIPCVYRTLVTVNDTGVCRRETCWSVESQIDASRALTVNRGLLEEIARQTEGEVASADRLDQFVACLPNRKIPIVETWTYPRWHHSSVSLVAHWS